MCQRIRKRKVTVQSATIISFVVTDICVHARIFSDILFTFRDMGYLEKK